MTLAVAPPRLETHAKRALRAPLGLAAVSRLTLRPPPAGVGGRTWLIYADGAPVGVLRALHSRRRLLRLREASARLLATGVPVARVLWSDASLLGRLRCGAYLMVEEHFEGAPWVATAGRPRAVHPLAGALARLHGSRHAAWGTLGRARRWFYGGFRLRQVRGQLHRLHRHGALSRAECRTLYAPFAAWRRRLDALRGFHLIHNDLHPENVLVSPDGALRLIDLYRLRFDCREKDLAAVCGRLLRFDRAAARAFEEAYEGAGGEAPDQRLLEFELAALCVARWRWQVEQAARRADEAVGRSILDEARRWREWSLERVGGLQPPAAG